MTINQEVKEDYTSAYIELFEIDTAGAGGTLTYYITPGAPVTFNGNLYSTFPMSISGLVASSDGAPARPLVSVSTINRLFASLVLQYGDLVGARLIYTRTFENYIASGISAPPAYYTISKLVQKNKFTLQWELKSDLDLDRKVLPKRQMLRDDINNNDGLQANFPGLGQNKNVK